MECLGQGDSLTDSSASLPASQDIRVGLAVIPLKSRTRRTPFRAVHPPNQAFSQVKSSDWRVVKRNRPLGFGGSEHAAVHVFHRAAHVAALKRSCTQKKVRSHSVHFSHRACSSNPISFDYPSWVPQKKRVRIACRSLATSLGSLESVLQRPRIGSTGSGHEGGRAGVNGGRQWGLGVGLFRSFCLNPSRGGSEDPQVREFGCLPSTRSLPGDDTGC